MLQLKFQSWNLKNPTKTKHGQIKSFKYTELIIEMYLISKVEVDH